ncbi:MAG: DUF934 domain-containing protein [Pseudomonadota bacterium]
MGIIRNGRQVEDSWVYLANGDDANNLPHDLIVDLATWRENKTDLTARNGRLGVKLASHEVADEIGDDASCFDLIVLDFPTFTDGRAYSTARILRERYGFSGELRASGQVLRDQLFYLVRCGFDSFEVADDRPLAGWFKALSEIAFVYQPTGDGRPWILSQRHSDALAEQAS